MRIEELVVETGRALSEIYRATDNSGQRGRITRAYSDLVDVALYGRYEQQIAYKRLFFHQCCPYMKHEAAR